jgi:hypothetical protein
MRKFECTTPRCQRKVPCALISDEESNYPPICCPHTGTYTGWRIIEESKEEQKLPKLTAEVFNRPDCPKSAVCATVDTDGTAYFHLFTPVLYTNEWQKTNYCQKIPGKWDATNWTEIIKRPAKVLPDWVEEGAVGYDNEQKRYFRVTDIDKKWVDIEYLDDGIGATCSYADMQNCSEARKRPFYDVEMQRSVGRVFTTAAGDVSIASDFDNYPKILCILGTWFNRKELADSAWLLDGKPCYVLEHLVDGEWVK